MSDDPTKAPSAPPKDDPDATLVVDGRRLWAALETTKSPSTPPGEAAAAPAVEAVGDALAITASSPVVQVPPEAVGPGVATPAAAPAAPEDTLDDDWESVASSGPATSRGLAALPVAALAATPPAPAVAEANAGATAPASAPTTRALEPRPSGDGDAGFLDSDLLEEEEATPSQSRIATARPPASEEQQAAPPLVPASPALPTDLGPAPSTFITPLGFAKVTEPEAGLKTPIPERSPTPPPPPRRGPSAVDMEDRFSMGDFAGAMAIAEELLARDATHEEALECVARCRAAMRASFQSKLGPLDRVPIVVVVRDQLRWLSIDHKAGFVLSHVDGVSNLEEIIDISGMKELEALGILAELAEQRIIGFR